MTKEDAQRIQSAADKSGKNQDFKRRAMSAAGRAANQKKSSNKGNQKPQKKKK